MRRGCFGTLVCSANNEKKTMAHMKNGLRMPHPYVKEEKKKSGSRNENEPSEKTFF